MTLDIANLKKPGKLRFWFKRKTDLDKATKS